MILLNNFFSFASLEHSSDTVKARLILNTQHDLYRGHFPEFPVVPGAFMVQIIIEIMESVTGRKLSLKEADVIKFLTVIDPTKNPEVETAVSFTTAAGEVVINASLFEGSVIFFKLKATLIFA